MQPFLHPFILPFLSSTFLNFSKSKQLLDPNLKVFQKENDSTVANPCRKAGLSMCDVTNSICYSLVRKEVTKKMLGPCPLPLSAFARWLPAFWSCPNGDPYNLLNHWRYKLLVRTKKFCIDIKRCNKVLFFKNSARGLAVPHICPNLIS